MRSLTSTQSAFALAFLVTVLLWTLFAANLTSLSTAVLTNAATLMLIVATSRMWSSHNGPSIVQVLYDAEHGHDSDS